VFDGFGVCGTDRHRDHQNYSVHRFRTARINVNASCRRVEKPFRRCSPVVRIRHENAVCASVLVVPPPPFGDVVPNVEAGWFSVVNVSPLRLQPAGASSMSSESKQSILQIPVQPRPFPQTAQADIVAESSAGSFAIFSADRLVERRENSAFTSSCTLSRGVT